MWASYELVVDGVEGLGEAVAAVEVVAFVARQVVKWDGSRLAGCAVVACDTHELGGFDGGSGHCVANFVLGVQRVGLGVSRLCQDCNVGQVRTRVDSEPSQGRSRRWYINPLALLLSSVDLAVDNATMDVTAIIQSSRRFC